VSSDLPEISEGPGAPRPDVLPHQHLSLSAEERRSGRLSPEHLSLARLILSCRGYVILRDALEPDFIQLIGREMEEIYQDCRATLGQETGTAPDALHSVHVSQRKRATFWFRKSRWRIFPRLVPPMSDPRLLANAFVVAILESLLGPDFYCKYMSSDTCVNGAILQSPHSDIDGDHVFVDNEWRPRGYVVNVPTMECGLHNGPLEVWPGGSHMWTTRLLEPYGLEPNVQDGRNPPVERIAEYLPSIKVALLPGEILIRDLAMWHRGTPNPTDKPRTMLTIGFFRGDHAYGYGDPSYNLDEGLYRQLPPRLQRMFAYYFSPLARLRRTRRQVQSRVKRAAKEWLESRLGGR
jgi:ectoine hydroxylase-related dioxygenase (phytanoyl-CoA dioxygenase family)